MSTRSAALPAVMVAMLVVPTAAAAQDSPRPEAVATALSPDSHVRALDREARTLLEAAVALSPTVARLVVALQATDLIVGVETRAYDAATRGELRVVTATADVRYLRMTVKVPGGRRDLVSVLGHELQHALELSMAPQVRDQASLRAFYQQIGWPAMNGGYFETDAALETGRRVAAEVAAARSARKRGSPSRKLLITGVQCPV